MKVQDPQRVGVKAETTDKDRDGNGRRERQPDPDYKEKLTDQEFEEAIKALHAFEGVKASGLTIELLISGEVKVVLVKDPEGKVVRRIPESELWPLIKDKFKTTGHLLNKAG